MPDPFLELERKECALDVAQRTAEFYDAKLVPGKNSFLLTCKAQNGADVMLKIM